MKKFIWSLGILICLIAGCVKSNNNTTANTCNYTDSHLIAPAGEIDSVQKYLTLHAITATQNSSGFFYTIDTLGTGTATTNLCSVVAIKYTARLTNGSVFDSTGTNAIIFQLFELLPGLQKGLPLISKGGKITIYIPPTLGYGNIDRTNNAGVVIIPANSVLIFDIELVDVG